MIKRKIKTALLLGTLSMAIISGCSKENTSSETASETLESTAQPVKEEVVIHWVTSGSDVYTDVEEIPPNNIKEVNRLLEEKGYACKIKIDYYDTEGAYRHEFQNGSEIMLGYLDDDNVEADIIWGGNQFVTDVPMYSFIENGLAEPLSKYFETEQGKKLREAYSENIWKASEYKGENYYIPNACIGMRNEFYIEFNPDYVSADEVAAFDGTMKSLKALAEEKGHSVYFNNINLSEMSGYSKCTMKFGALISNEDGTAGVHNYEKLYDDMKALNDLYMAGGLFLNKEYGKLLPDDKTDYVAWVMYGEPDKSNAAYIHSYGVNTVTNIAGQSTAICSKSKNKELAFEVLTEILLDEELSNALLYGVEDEDYELADGVVHIPNHYISSGRMEILTGCYINSYNAEYDSFSQSRAEKCRAYWDSLGESKYLGFVFDFSNCKEGAEAVEQAYVEEYPDITSESFDEDWSKFIELNKTPAAQAMYDEMNRQLTCEQ